MSADLQPAGLENLLDAPQLAELLGVKVRHIRRLVFERRVPFVKWGALVRFDPVDIRAWLDQCRHDIGPPTATKRGVSSKPRRRPAQAEPQSDRFGEQLRFDS